MGRNIEIKYIEDSTKRQVTYCKRKKGILKKARELAILSDAQICLTMFSSTGKLAEYVSPSTTMKEIFDRYQRENHVDLWEAQYEVISTPISLFLYALQEELKTQQEIGSRLKMEIRQRRGQDDFSELSIEELSGLKENLAKSLETVRDWKSNYGSASPTTGLFIDGGGIDCKSSEITFQQLDPSHTDLHNEAGAA
ncbi:hypothetical protein MKW94_023639 [Papaver nudicaule]|uniref:MADS-box domain-containing protein n=1 Tax=Papaver nudicaule TaxID=74823 RepID=A0AA42AS68_PAPNU|nr:hypothetical protein [Papaver nudicaule]